MRHRAVDRQHLALVRRHGDQRLRLDIGMLDELRGIMCIDHDVAGGQRLFRVPLADPADRNDVAGIVLRDDRLVIFRTARVKKRRARLIFDPDAPDGLGRQRRLCVGVRWVGWPCIESGSVASIDSMRAWGYSA